MKATLAEFGVACVSGWYSGRLAEGTLDDERAACRAHMEKLAFNDCRVVVYGEVAGSIQGRMDTPLGLSPLCDDAAWRYAEQLDAFGQHYAPTTASCSRHHHRMGAYVGACWTSTA